MTPFLEYKGGDNRMEQPMLTISILISGQLDNVKRTLDSIQPILKQVPSELLLTDTGCDSKVRRLIEGYTDHIIDFTWIYDFSAARNVGLQQAKGQWFMYLDDDEWFEDPSDIIEFLLSEEQLEYDVAVYYQRNYQDENMTRYMDYGVDRILRRTPELHFENRIHEAYAGIAVRKTKQLNSYVHHMGYIFHNEEEKRNKYERNGQLLEKECMEKPDDMRLWHQYAANFWSIEEWEKSAEICRKAIQRESNSIYWDMLHTALLFCLSMENKWEESIETCLEFSEKTLYPYQQFGVRQFLVQAYFQTKQFDKVCEMAQKVINTYRYYKRKPEEFQEAQMGGNVYFGEDNISHMLLNIMVSAIHEQDNNIAKLLENQEIKEEIQQLSHNQILSMQMVGYVLQYGSGEEHTHFIENYKVLKGILDTSGYYTYLEQCQDENLEIEEKKIGGITLNALDFMPEFFEPETRDGFYIEPLMKNAWAAQLEILHHVGEICQKHGIKYFVDWGTLLGAVRHKGYIPWDDDIDIGMLREDYRRFSEVVDQYDDIKLCNEYNTNEWGEHAARITTRTEISVLRSDIKARRGFPFPVGVDLFVVDYAPDDEDLRAEQKEVINQIASAYTAKKWLAKQDFSSEEYADKFMQYSYLVRQIEEKCHIKFSQQYPTSRELLILIDEVGGMYGSSDGRMMTQTDCFISRDNYFISAEAYADVIMVPFENIMVPIPVGYDEILRVKYGEEYMTPINIGAGHGYPFYNTFVRELFDLDEEDDLTEAREYVEKMSSTYYREYFTQGCEPSVMLSDSYFEESQEEGTLVTEELKRIRAAELEILWEIQRLCKKHNLTYYAYGDTLLGAALYQGFVPGGEDICIAMSREDYKKFLKLTQTELGAWFDYHDVYANGDHTDMRSYVMSDGYMVSEDAYLKRFHGCPHVVAVCVAAIDGIGNIGEKENIRTAYIQGLLRTSQFMPTEPPYTEDVLQVVEEWRQISDVVINTKVNLKREFVRCADVVSMAGGDDQSEYVRISAELQHDINRYYRRSWFDGSQEVPFESISMAVPKGYREILREM